MRNKIKQVYWYSFSEDQVLHIILESGMWLLIKDINVGKQIIQYIFDLGDDFKNKIFKMTEHQDEKLNHILDSIFLVDYSATKDFRSEREKLEDDLIKNEADRWM